MSETSFVSPRLRDEDETNETPVSTPSGMSSIYDALREELSTPPVFEEYETIPVPGKPRLALKVSTKMSLKRLEILRKRAVDKKSKSFDLARFSADLIVAQTACVQLDGEDGTTKDGDLLDFKHPELHEMVGAMEDRGAVVALIPRDADLVSIGQDILSACGYGETDEEDEDNDPLDYENA
jgi:hypothetical protein